MRYDPILVDETRGWFLKAKEDIRAAAVDVQAEPPLLEDAMFHAQQAVEKTLKSFLTWHNEPFRKTPN
jgi:HEPN domain-containing protein